MLESASGITLGPAPGGELRAGPADSKQIIEWTDATFSEGLVMSTSFGIQAAVTLHLATRVVPEIPVIWVDTGYLPPETHRFAEQLIERLSLNIHAYRSPLAPAEMEALHGRLWEQGDADALNLYDQIRKVEPMQRALRELGATAWLAGLRTQQTDHRKRLPILGRQWDRYKILPILDWTTQDVHQYLKVHDLPYHPLFDQGYATVGDWHSSRPLSDGDAHERDTRFRGLKQECGLHLTRSYAEPQGSTQSLHS